jgi:hypothetical protein
MPYAVHKRGKGWAIVNKRTGRTVGHSSSKAKAQRSVNARNAGAHGWKGSR